MKILRRSLVFALAACAAWGQARAGDGATIVRYIEQEAGVEPHPVRYIVTANYMRSDDGVDDGDYLLYDRGRHKIFTVVQETRTVLEMDGAAPVPPTPAELSVGVRERVDQQAPEVAGVAPVQVDLVADGELCHSALVAPGLLESVRAVLQEFNLALAARQWQTLERTPAEFKTPCFLARYLYASDFHLTRGMVLADWNAQGERRELTNYETGIAVPESLFRLPEGFRRISVDSL
ncbi:MAG: hypothetical protein ACWGNB_08670 [Thiogranum sp.]